MSEMPHEIYTEIDAQKVEHGLIDTLIALAEQKKLVIGLPVATAILATAVSFVLPNVYLASARLLPPQQAQSGAAALLSQLGGAPGSAVGAIGGIKNPSDVYVGMLQSRRVGENIVKKFDLSTVYDQSSHEKTLKKLADNTAIVAGKDGFITINVEDENRERVAQMANTYVEELQKLTKVLAVTEAGQRRMFFERQFEATKENLAKAEAALKGALTTQGVISVDNDTRALVETIGRLRARISAKQIELNSMKAFVTANNPEYKRVQEELNSSEVELSRLENGRPETQEAAKPASNKQGGLDNIKILRDVKYQQMLYELLAKQYEVARLDEAKDTSTIQVLDNAVEPERKSKPKRALIVLIATAISLFLAIGLALGIDTAKRSLAKPGQGARLRRLRSLIAGK